MLFRPQLPTAPQLPEQTTYAAVPSTFAAGPAPVAHDHASACACQHTPAPVAPAAPTRGSLSNVSTGAIAAVLVGGVIVTALLTAVAVSAISVAVAAVVLRSLLNSQHRHR